METTRCQVTINPGINSVDRLLLMGLFSKINREVDEGPHGESLTMEVTLSDWSALCVLEDLDILTCEQI